MQDPCKIANQKRCSHNARMKQYFELPGWGIKLRWCNTSDQVRYYATDYDSKGNPKTCEFTTKNTEEMKQCPMDKNGRLGATSREKRSSESWKEAYLYLACASRCTKIQIQRNCLKGRA